MTSRRTPSRLTVHRARDLLSRGPVQRDAGHAPSFSEVHIERLIDSNDCDQNGQKLSDWNQIRVDLPTLPSASLLGQWPNHDTVTKGWRFGCDRRANRGVSRAASSRVKDLFTRCLLRGHVASKLKVSVSRENSAAFELKPLQDTNGKIAKRHHRDGM